MLKLFRSVGVLMLAGTLAVTGALSAYGDSRETYIILPKPGAASEVKSLIAGLGEYPEEQLVLLDDLFLVDLLPEAAAEIAQSELVDFVERDSGVATSGSQDAAPSWGLDRIDGVMDGSFAYPDKSGEGVLVYVFDTGVAADHPDLIGRVSQGFDVVGNGQANTDCHFHGTHVAGTIAGTLYGVAKKASIVPLRVLNCSGFGSMTGVIRAINWTIANHPVGTPAVANFSLGGGKSSGLNAAISSLVESGISTVVAAGNERTDACTRSPASAPDAITVGATDRFDTRSSFSNFGECVDAFAPGSAIPSLDARDFSKSLVLSGTSMAAPHVAGIAALLLGNSPLALPDQISGAISSLAKTGIVNNSNTAAGNRLAMAPSEKSEPLPSLSGAPTGVRSTGTGPGVVEFGWDPIEGATGYQVEIRRGSQNTVSLADSQVPSFKVTGLTGGEFVYIRVRGYAENVTTRFSSLISARAPFEAPSAPRELVLQATSKTGMVMTWAPPSYAGGTANISYRIEMRTNQEWGQISSGPTRELRISGLNSKHEFRVFARNEAGESLPSPVVVFDPASVFAVQTISATVSLGSNLDLSWVSDAPQGTKFEVSIQQLGQSTATTILVDGLSHRFTSLLRMTNYRVTVVPLAGPRGLSAAVNVTTGAVVPSAPRPSSSLKQENGFLLRFAAPSDNGGVPVLAYRLEVLSNTDWTAFQTSASTSFEVPLPLRGRTVEYRLIAVNAVGESIPSSVLRISTPATTTSAPANFSASLQPDGRVMMSWSAPIDDGGSPVSSYRIEILRETGWAVVGTTRDITNSSQILARGTSASFRVLALNGAGLSTASNVVSLSRDATAPGDITNLSAQLVDGIVRLSWSAPRENGGSAILGYQVERKVGPSWIVLSELVKDLTSNVVMDVPGSAMTFRVLAVTSVGKSVTGNERTVTIPFLQASAPTEFSATVEGNRVRFSWKAPESSGGSTVSSYVISASTDGKPFVAVLTAVATAREIQTSLPAPGKSTTYRIQARTVGFGDGRISEPVTLAIPAIAPGDPATLTGQLKAGEGVLLSWTAPNSDGGSDLLGYRVEVSSGRSWKVLAEVTGTSFLAPLGLPGESLVHRVVAFNAVGSSAGIRTLQTRMGIAPATAPLQLLAAAVQGKLTLTWKAPEVLGGTFSSYEIQILDGSTFRRLGSATGTSFVTTVPGQGLTATYRIAAVTNAGIGAFSEQVAFTNPKTVPAAPTSLALRSTGSTNMATWRVGSAGGGTLAEAILYREEQGRWIEVAKSSATAGSLTFANDLFGQTHRYQLRLTNEIGESPTSSVVSLRHAIVVAGVATGLALTTRDGRLNLAWQTPQFTGGSAPAYVDIQASTDGKTWARASFARYVNSMMFNLPAKGKSISYRVVIRNAAGDSAPSEVVSFTNPFTAPVGSIGVSASKSGDKVVFRISSPGDFGGYSELGLRVERQGALAWLSSDEVKITRTAMSVTISLPLPPRGTHTYRIVLSNPSGELEQSFTFRH